LTTFKEVISLQFSYKDFAFEENFKKLSSLLKKTPNDSIIVAPELCLSNFCYKDMKKAANFSKEIESDLINLTKDRTLCLSMIEEKEGSFYNRAKLIHNRRILYQRDKYELFKLGDEHKYFKRGKLEDIEVVQVDGIRYAVLICFELRFINLWEKIKGADVILVPSLWGKPRKKQLEIIANSLSVINQCFVIVSNSSNDDMAKSSLISSPFGDICKDDRRSYIQKRIDLSEIKKMRRYLDIGIK